MEKGINLTLPKSFFEFDKLLDQAVEAAQIKKLSTPNNIHGINTLNFLTYLIMNFLEIVKKTNSYRHFQTDRQVLYQQKKFKNIFPLANLDRSICYI